MPKHRASSPDSERLAAVMRALRNAGSRGLSNMELVVQTRVSDPKDAVYELRGFGVPIRSTWHRSPRGRRYVRYVLEPSGASAEIPIHRQLREVCDG